MIFIVFLSQRSGHGVSCCYNNDGILVTGSPGGSSSQLVAEDVDTEGNLREDVLPFIYCCKGLFPNCAAFYERRPAGDGSVFDPLPPG